MIIAKWINDAAVLHLTTRCLIHLGHTRERTDTFFCSGGDTGEFWGCHCSPSNNSVFNPPRLCQETSWACWFAAYLHKKTNELFLWIQCMLYVFNILVSWDRRTCDIGILWIIICFFVFLCHLWCYWWSCEWVFLLLFRRWCTYCDRRI